MDVKQIDTAVVIKSVISHAVANDLFVYNSGKAIARDDFPTNKFSPLVILTANEVKGAKSVYVILDGGTNRNHDLRNREHS